LTLDELKEFIKKTLPDTFHGLNFKKLMKAFDLNGNGLIEQAEFCNLLDMAARSGAAGGGFANAPGAAQAKPAV